MLLLYHASDKVSVIKIFAPRKTYHYEILLQANQEKQEHQKYFWTVNDLQEKSQSGVRKLNCKQER